MSKTKSEEGDDPAVTDVNDVSVEPKSQDNIESQSKHAWTNSKLYRAWTDSSVKTSPTESETNSWSDNRTNSSEKTLTTESGTNSRPDNRISSSEKTLTTESGTNSRPDNRTSNSDKNGAYSNTLDNLEDDIADNIEDDEFSEMFADGLDDVTSFDEIPSVLFLTGDIDLKTLQKAIALSKQKQMLKTFQEQNLSKQAEKEKSRSFSETYPSNQNKNKNVKMAARSSSVNSKSHEKRSSDTEDTNPDVPAVLCNLEYVKPDEDIDYEKQKVEKTELDIIRKKRLEKLDKPKAKNETSKTTDQVVFRPALLADDNRQVVMREEELLKRKTKNKGISDKGKLNLPKDTLDASDLLKSDSVDVKGNVKYKTLGEDTNLKAEEAKKIKKDDLNEVTSKTPKPQETKSSSKNMTIPGKETQNTKKPSNKGEDDATDDDDDGYYDIPYAVRISMSKHPSNTPKSKPNTKLHISSVHRLNAADDNINEGGQYNSVRNQSMHVKSPKGKTLPNKQDLGPQKGHTPAKKTQNTVDTSLKDGNTTPTRFRILVPLYSMESVEDEPYTTKHSKTPFKNKNQTSYKTIDVRNKTVTGPKPDARMEQSTKVKPAKVTPKTLKLELSDVAQRRAKAFKRVKQGQHLQGIHCSSCGRADCNSIHVQKMREMMRAAKQTGFEVRDVAPDGNCMFAAVVDQLEFYSNFKFGSKSLREAAVNWLIENPRSEDGTLFESFLEQDWQTYLQRMLGEGQWGDHIVLRAIVQVVGHTVKIMSADNRTCHWTILEPSNISGDTDDTPLILGHVGEFHYVSLRPSDSPGSGVNPLDETAKDETQTVGVPVDLTEIQLEGTESIAMFQEEYIDLESQIPILHFSYLIKKLVPKSIIDNAAIIASSMEETYTYQMDEITQSVLVGEVGNKVFIDLLFGPDIMAMTKALLVNTKSKVISEMDERTLPGDYILDEAAIHPGFVKLRKRNTRNMYFPNTILQWPSSQKDIDKKSRYYKPVLLCQSWPGCAQSWIWRVRCENWPPQHVVNDIVSSGCVLKPNSHKRSLQPGIEWQIGFELAEKTLFKDAVTPSQQYCYILWKSLIMQTTDLSGPVSFEHIRTVFLYACERIPVDFWVSSPGACFLYMFDELLRHIKDGYFPNYFVPTNNMMDDLTEKELREAGEKIMSVRNQPFLFVLQFHEACRFLARGTKVIQMIQDDVSKFSEHHSIRRTTLETLVPASILIAKEYLKAGHLVFGFDMLSQTYEERLSVSTCDDTLPYHLYLQDALNELDQDTIVWFSAYAEIHMKGQLPKPIIVEFYGNQELVKISDIIPVECTGDLADTLVPRAFSYNMYNFCNEFAMFLKQVGKADTVRAVLYHAHDTYKKYLQAVGEPEQDIDIAKESAVMQIYSGLCTILREQGQTAKLNEFYPYMEKLATRIRCPSSLSWLITIYSCFNQTERLGIIREAMMNTSPRSADKEEIAHYYFKRSVPWPFHKAMKS